MRKHIKKPKRSRLLLSSDLLCRVLKSENKRLQREAAEQSAWADQYHATAHELWLENQRLKDDGYELLEQAVRRGCKVQTCTINQNGKAVAWSDVKTIDRRFALNRYRIAA